jgi:hypothetical protein
MATEQRVPRVQPRLVRVEDSTSQADVAWSPKSAARLLQVVESELPALARTASEPAEPTSSMQCPVAVEAPAQSRNYLQALEMLGSAARAMATIEDESQRIRANAFALTQRVRSERIEADQHIGVLQEQLRASHSLAEQLKRQLAEAEERANAAEVKANHSLTEKLEQQLAQAEERANLAEEWLQRFQETIVSTFSARRAAEAASQVPSL